MLPRVSAERPREISMCRDRASPLVPAHIREARHGRRNQSVINGGRDAFPKHICVHQDFLFGSRTSANEPNKDTDFQEARLALAAGPRRAEPVLLDKICPTQ